MMPADIGDFGSATQKILGRVPPGEPKGHNAPLQKLNDEDRREVVEQILREVFVERDNSYTATVDTPKQLKAAIKSAIQKVASRTSLKASANWAAEFLADRLMSSLKDTVKYTTMGGEEINVKPTQKEFKAALDKAIEQAPSGPSVWDNKEAKEKKAAAAAAEEPEEEEPAATEEPEETEEEESNEEDNAGVEISDEEERALEVLKRLFSKMKRGVSLRQVLMKDPELPIRLRDDYQAAKEVYTKLIRAGFLENTDDPEGDYIKVGHDAQGYTIETKSKEEIERGGEALDAGEEGEDFDSVVQDRAKKLQMGADPYGKREFVKRTIARDYEGGSTRDYDF
jgi:hypothetical protein